MKLIRDVYGYPLDRHTLYPAGTEVVAATQQSAPHWQTGVSVVYDYAVHAVINGVETRPFMVSPDDVDVSAIEPGALSNPGGRVRLFPGVQEEYATSRW